MNNERGMKAIWITAATGAGTMGLYYLGGLSIVPAVCASFVTANVIFAGMGRTVYWLNKDTGYIKGDSCNEMQENSGRDG